MELRRLSRFRRPLAWLVALIALAFLARVLIDSGSELQRYPVTANPGFVLLALAALMAPLVLAVPPWQWSLRWLGAPPLSFAAAARIWFMSNFVRYVPGNVWQPVTMVVLARDRGIDEVRTATSATLNLLLSNLSALLVAGIYWALDPGGPSRDRLWLLLPISAGALACLHPAVLGRAMQLALRLTRRPPSEFHLSFGRVLLLLAFHGFIWIAYGVAFAVFWSALYPLDWHDLPRLTGAFAGAYAIGFLSLLTPSGLGVREGALVFLLSDAYPAALVTVVALLSRLWLIAGELICTALVLAVGTVRRA